MEAIVSSDHRQRMKGAAPAVAAQRDCSVTDGALRPGRRGCPQVVLTGSVKASIIASLALAAVRSNSQDSLSAPLETESGAFGRPPS